MIRLLTEDEAILYKNLRLHSLKTDPISFLSTYEVESHYDLSFFVRKIINTTKPPFYGIYGFFEDNKLIAYALLSDSYYYNKRHIAYINEIFVEPNYRNKNIATKLIKFLIKKAKEEKRLEQIHLKVNSQNKKAISLYEKLGFKKHASLKNAVKNPDRTYQDECFFVLKI